MHVKSPHIDTPYKVLYIIHTHKPKQQVGKGKKKKTECRQVSLEKHFQKGVSKCLDVESSGRIYFDLDLFPVK